MLYRVVKFIASQKDSYQQADVNYKEFEVDIFSPLLDVVAKLEIIEKTFPIFIRTDLIEKYNLENDYIEAFKKMNQSNVKYSGLIFHFYNPEHINYLEKFNINFGQIKGLFIEEKRDENTDFDDYEIGNNNYDNNSIEKKHLDNYSNFLKKLFSLNNIGNSLLILDIKLNSYKIQKIEPNLIAKINDFKILEKLYYMVFI